MAEVDRGCRVLTLRCLFTGIRRPVLRRTVALTLLKRHVCFGSLNGCGVGRVVRVGAVASALELNQLGRYLRPGEQ